MVGSLSRNAADAALRLLMNTKTVNTVLRHSPKFVPLGTSGVLLPSTSMVGRGVFPSFMGAGSPLWGSVSQYAFYSTIYHKLPEYAIRKAVREALSQVGVSIPQETEEARENAKNKAALLAQVMDDEVSDITHSFHDNLQRLLESIHNNHYALSADDKTRILIEALNFFRFDPVITAHPTEVRTDGAINTMLEISDILDKAHQTQCVEGVTGELVTPLVRLYKEPFIASERMTTDQEAARFVTYWMRMVKVYPSIKQEIVKKVEETFYGGHTMPQLVYDELVKAIKHQFEVRTWVLGDRDGNENIDGAAMRRAIVERQHAVLEFYAQEGKRISDKLNRALAGSTSEQERHDIERARILLESNKRFWSDVLKTMQVMGVSYNAQNNEFSKRRTLVKLNKVLALPMLPKEIKEEILRVREMIDLMGYIGIPKADIREDSARYTKAMNDVFALLKAHAMEYLQEANSMAALLEETSYEALSTEKKYKFIDELGKNPRWFALVRKHQAELGAEAMRCFGCMAVQLEFPDIFNRDILSEGKDVLNALELVTLQSITRYFEGKYHIGDFGRLLGRVLFLQETKHDLENSFGIISSLYKDHRGFEEFLRKEGVLQSLKGPSDNTARGGLFTMVSILQSMNDEARALQQLKEKNPALAEVYIRTFHGSGGDWKRQLTALIVLHQTVQGRAAYDYLAKGGAMRRSLYGAVGQMGEVEKMAQELALLQQTSPQDYDTVMGIVDYCAKDYSNNFINDTSVRMLYAAIVKKSGAAILSGTNVSSRAGSKFKKSPITGDVPDIRTQRAISIVTYGLVVGIGSDISRTMAGLKRYIGEHEGCIIPDMTRLTVLKNIVTKVLFSIAGSDFKHAWQRLGIEVPSRAAIMAMADEYEGMSQEQRKQSPSHVLAHLQKAALDDLDAVVMFLPDGARERVASYITDRREKVYDTISIDKLLQSALEQSGDTHLARIAENARYYHGSYVKPFQEAWQRYEEKPTKENFELAVGWIRSTNLSRPFVGLQDVESRYGLQGDDRLLEKSCYEVPGGMVERLRKKLDAQCESRGK